MKKKWLTIIALVLLAVSCQDLKRSKTEPNGLMVEYIREPANLQIQDSLPEYSWIVPSSVKKQKAYQIIVSSNEQNCKNNVGNVWDSQQVHSEVSINIEHGAAALKPNTTYFWKVRIWDQKNNPTSYSRIQVFNTGDFIGTVSTQNRFMSERISPVVFNEISNGLYFIDFGKDAFGTIELNYKAKSEEILTVRLGEKSKNGRVDPKPGGSIRYKELELKVSPENTSYILEMEPDKRNTKEHAIAVPDSFGVVTPFRYAEIENAKQPIRKDNIIQKAFFYYFDYDQSKFTSSDTILNQVWGLCKYSMKATSVTGYYIDGDRERIPYEADAHINQLSHYAVDREYTMAKQTIEYFMGHATWPTEWLLHTALIMYQDYYYTGDTELIEAYYEKLKAKTLIALMREDGLITTHTPLITDDYMRSIGFKDLSKKLKDIVDWPPGKKDTRWEIAREDGERDGYVFMPINTVVNSFFYRNMVIMAEFSDVLNKNSEAEYFRKLAEKVKKSINEKLFDKTRGVYIDGEGTTHASLHANMMPLAFGLVPQESIASVTEFVKSRGMACSVYGAQYLLEGLYKAGEDQYGLDLMTATHDRSWYNMIKVGSTITLEAWDFKYKPNLDWNHAWGAAPGNIIARYLWGIKPKTPGFAVARIYPQMGSLTKSSIEMPTMYGNIKGSFQIISENNIEYILEIPANMKAEFIAEKYKENTIFLNGEKVNLIRNIISLEPGINKLEIKQL